jgi:hypothetical protein
VKLTDDQPAEGNNQKDQQRQADYKLLRFRKEVVGHASSFFHGNENND